MTISLKTRRIPGFLLAVTLSAVTVLNAQKTIPPKDRAIALLNKNILATGLNQVLLNSFQVSNAYEDKRSGNFLVYLQQAYADVPVYNKISIYIFRNDTLLQKTTDFIRRFPVTSATNTSYTIDPDRAVVLAANHLAIALEQFPKLLRKESKQKFIFQVPGLGIDSTSAELIWLPQQNETNVKLAWNVRIVSPDRQGDWFVRIDAKTGDFLDLNSLVVSEQPGNACVFDAASTAGTVESSTGGFVASRTANFSFNPPSFNTANFDFAPPSVTSAGYRVYPIGLESPNFGSRVLEVNPWLRAGSSNNAVTLGWHFDNSVNYDVTRGNNVWAQEDIAGTNSTSGITDNSSTAIPNLTFDRALNASSNPSVGDNLRAGIDNVFYWSNIMHDVSYQYGFDEAAGNFQASNLGRGGFGNDYVHGFAESGAGLNNANFSTPPDGYNPTMRMYQWNYAVSTTFNVTAPAAVAGNYSVVEGGLTLNSQLAYTGSKTGNIVQAIDANGTTQACAPLSNGSSVAGNIALIDRGGSGCPFSLKIKNAQNAGAIAVIIINNVGTAPFSMSGSDNTITIPSVMISLANGNTLKANLTGLAGTLSSSGVMRDGSLDNGIISHEYTHGISTRLTGGAANAGCLVNAEQMGEGWSDYLALMLTTNWSAATVADGPNARPIGTYAISQAATGSGIRTYPYSTNLATDPWTYAMLATQTGGEVHTIGEIWCSVIWDMTWNIIQGDGISGDIYHGTAGNNIALQLVIEGMKYQPCSPGFLDARDAILKADSILYNYRHRCAIWNAFARRGMGKSASQGSSNSFTDQTPATDLPVGLGISKSADKTTFTNGDQITYSIKAYCDCGSLSNISIVDTLAPTLTYVSSTDGTYTAPVVRFNNLNFTPGETKTLNITATVSGSGSAFDTLINDTEDPANYTWTNTITSGGTQFAVSTARSSSTSHSWLAPDAGTRTDFALNSGNLLLDTLSILSFSHYFETDPGYDGGILEITTNNGASWQDLGPYMTQNKYNSTLDPSSTPVGNHPAFTGSTGGAFIQTVVTLSGFAGTTAKIRFRFVSDVTVGGEGWYIDDIVLRNTKGIVNNAFAYNGAALLSRNNTYGFFTSGTLPVHFISFEAQKQDKKAWLHWTVSDEINVSGYVVERSNDGRTFTQIGRVDYQTTNGNNDYYFTDEQPLAGVNYYRIAEQDIDGRLTRSDIKLVRFADAGITIKLAPVPTYNHSVNLLIGNAGARAYDAYLLNTVGQVLKAYKVKDGSNQLNLAGLSAGVYYVKIQLSGSMTEIRKLVID